ncbi:histone-lysine N-methyltransferase setd3, putative [Babesia ovis]|uniref:Histone-lysine N-methyltransferase setd3, putative n=1 Tax=Babesia ovis TaxID=5869 RepID=A0A9W5TE95_BABOV|nr:histone-lysine N-methyltransferase setd3, putative [Babesia ovis]
MLAYSIVVKCVCVLLFLLWDRSGLCRKSYRARDGCLNHRQQKWAISKDSITFVLYNTTRKTRAYHKSHQDSTSAVNVIDVDTSSPEHIVTNVYNVLCKNGLINSSIRIDSSSRLAYNTDAIVDTFIAARDTDAALTGNVFGNGDDKFFIRFDGDSGIERKLVASQTIESGSIVAKIPRTCCFSLSQIKDVLLSTHDSQHCAYHGPVDRVFHEHIQNLQRLNTGQFMKGKDTNVKSGDNEQQLACFTVDSTAASGDQYAVANDKSITNGTAPGGNSTIDSSLHEDDHGHELDNVFLHRLSIAITRNRMKLLKALIIADCIFSIGNVLTVALENEEYASGYLNPDEVELLLLSLGIFSEYHNAVFKAVMHVIYDPLSLPILPKEDVIKLSWVHHLLTKDLQHLPQLLPTSAINDIQEPIFKDRLTQRLRGLNDVLLAATDPLYVIQDRIEHLAQSHYKIEDTKPNQKGCGPLMTNRKINAEMAMESIETELISFDTNHGGTIGTDMFKTSRGDIIHIVGDTRMEHNVDNHHINIMSFFEQYLCGTLDPQEYANVSVESWLNALNSLVTRESLGRLFAGVVAHNMRLQRPKKVDIVTELTNRSLLHHAAPGINVQSSSDHSGPALNTDAHIVPFVDLVNHKSVDPNCIVEVDNDSQFNLKALHEIQPGEELLVNYGELDNNQMFLDYGMVPRLDPKCGVLMDIEPGLIHSAARSRGLSHLLPTFFPAGLAPEKRELLQKINIFDIPNDDGFLQLYNEPHYGGVPVQQYNEFMSKFMGRQNIYTPGGNDVDLESLQQQRTVYQEPLEPLFPLSPGNNKTPLKIVHVNNDGVPDLRLILALKISFCKTKKRIEWISRQDSGYLATSVNSPLDIEVFRVASLICCEFIKTRYMATIIDDLRQASDPSLLKLSEQSVPLETIRQQNTMAITNALVLAHALRAKMPLYRCATYYESIANNFERNHKH